MRKVLTLVGTRPELIKLSRVIHELGKYTQHVIVHSGQNYDYELNQIFFDDLRIPKPDHFLEAVGPSVAATIGNVIARFDEVLELIQPDAVLIYGDTNTCLGTLAAKRRHIPIFHMEAGNRCFDMRVPEEINRRVVDHLSDINMVITEHARRYLLAEGVPGERIFKVGSSMPEVLAHHRDEIEACTVLDDLGLTQGRFFVVSAHREENVDSPEALRSLLETLNALAVAYDFPVIFSAHPRTRARIAALGELTLDPRVRLVKPLGFHAYIRLQTNAALVISDSGTIWEEASILGFPAVTLRNAHERPEGMDEGTLIMCSISQDAVIDAVRVVMDQSAEFKPKPVFDYQGGAVSAKVVRIILSYIDYINRNVWRKE
jgi:UDP-N-acetylglucosamine 2-epimerase (non-hydrolysing)